MRTEHVQAAPPAAGPEHVAPEPTLELLYPGEVKRWELLIGAPMLAACVCIGLAFATSLHWFYGGAIAFGPGLGILAIIYLAISSDTNGVAHAPAVEVSTAETQTSSGAVAA